MRRPGTRRCLATHACVHVDTYPWGVIADDESEPKIYKRAVFENVFGWLEFVRLRPGMFVRGGSLHELQTLLAGYDTALNIHGVDEGVPRMDHFSAWLLHHTGWPLALGWATAIERHPVNGESAMDTFFRLASQYRQLRPTVRCRAVLGPHHAATGRHIVIGMRSRQPTPLMIDIVQYWPEPLYFLRFHYPDGPQIRGILMDGNGSHATTVEFARQWVEEEFQVRPDEWTAAEASDANG